MSVLARATLWEYLNHKHTHDLDHYSVRLVGVEIDTVRVVNFNNGENKPTKRYM